MEQTKKVKIPFLPGMVFEDQDRTDFKKSQNFQICQNTMVEKKKLVDVKPKTDLLVGFQNSLKNPEALQTMKDTLTSGKENITDREVQRIIDLPLLRFQVYLQQKIDHSSTEKFCFRKMNLLYYLEDHTMQINEPSKENSGMMHGMFFRRQRVIKNQ